MKKIVVYFIMMICLGILFTSAGSVPFTETESSDVVQDSKKVEIKVAELPKAVFEALETEDYANMDINKVYKVTESKLAVTSSVYYLIEFTGLEGELVNVKFDEKGNVLE